MAYTREKGRTMKGVFGTRLVDLGLFALGVVALLTVLAAGAAGAGAGKPTGELRIALAFLGAQRFVPWVEVPSGGIKHYQILVYDYLVGCTDDGQLSAEGGIAQGWQEAA